MKGRRQIFSFTNISTISINYLAKLIGGKIEYLPERPGDPLHTNADISLAKKILGWRPETSFEQGLIKVQKWFDTL